MSAELSGLPGWWVDRNWDDIKGVLQVLSPSSAYRRAGFAEPTARTDGAVGDGAPHFASQIDAALAQRHRLNRDVMPIHPPNDTPPREAA